jgi:hypothetical protein
VSARDWQGPDALRVLLVPLRSLSVDPQNARRHSKRNLDAIRASIAEFGQRKPVVVRDGVVIAGSGTLAAMDAEGFSEIAVVSAEDLTPDQARAYALADNQTGDLAEWDPEALSKMLGTIPDSLKSITGFDADELQAIATLAFSKSEADSEGAEKGNASEFASIKLTRDQYTIFEGALAKLREQEGQPDMSPARAVELLSAEYLSG